MSVKLRFSAVLVGLCLLAFGSPGFAQGGITPIQIGQNAIGTLTAQASSAQFALTASSGETAMIQVLALSSGFVPQFSVVNPEGVEILTVANPNGQATLAGNAAFDEAGVYIIVVTGENGSVGQFALSLQPGAALPEATTLTINQPVVATVGSQTPVQVYRFDTTSLGAIAIMVFSQTPEAGPLVTLYSESAGRTIASTDAGVIGATYLLPATGGLYRVEVSAVGSGDTAFTICLGTCGLPAGNSAVQPTLQIVPPIATPEVLAGCSAMSSAGGSVNLRSGPGTTYAVLASLPLGQTVQVVGVWTGGGWYVVNVNGSTLWVGGSVVSLSGDCSTLAKVAAPTNAPLAPTAAPTHAPPPSNPPTDTPQPTTALPDLTTINLQISVDAGGTYNAAVTILNNGKAALTTDQLFAVLVCVDGFDNCNEYDSQSISLQPGETMMLNYSLPSFDVGGNHTVNVTLDGRNEVAESDESNNTAFASFNS